jgi:hypothetical protein
MGNKQSDYLLNVTPSSVVTVHPPTEDQRGLYATRRRAIILVGYCSPSFFTVDLRFVYRVVATVWRLHLRGDITRSSTIIII